MPLVGRAGDVGRRWPWALARCGQDGGHGTSGRPAGTGQAGRPELFGFLLDAGFLGPETTDGGLAYHRPGLHVEIPLYPGHEPELVTGVRHEPGVGTPVRSASLDCLYVACRCGVLQDVPGSAPNLRTTAKRVRQHADALRRVLPHLLTADVGRLIARCRGRLLPDP